MESVIGHLNLLMADMVFLRRTHFLWPLEAGEGLGDNWRTLRFFKGLDLDFNSADLGLWYSINFIVELLRLGNKSLFDAIRERST